MDTFDRQVKSIASPEEATLPDRSDPAGDHGRQALATSLELAKNAVRARTLEELQFILVNDTRALLPFDRSILIVHLDGESAPAATNNQPKLEQKADFVKRVNTLSPFLKPLYRALVLFAGNPKTDDIPEESADKLRDYLAYSGCSCLMIIPLSVYDHTVGHLVLEFFGDVAPGQVETLALMNTVPFLSSALAEKWGLAKSRRAREAFLRSIAGRSPQEKRFALWMKIGMAAIILAAIVLVLWLPTNLKLGGNAEVAPEYEYFAFVETEGIIEKVFAKTGEVVTKGRLVAALDPKEIDYRIREAERLRESYAAEMEILRNMGAEDPGKLAESQLVAIKGQRAKVKLDYLKWQRQFLEIRAPVDGTILTDRVESLVGKKFKPGEPFCSIAPHDVLLTEILVKESDIGFVNIGQEAQVYFNFEPNKGHRLTVKAISPKSEALERVGSVFRVKAEFLEQPPHLKPGMKGVAHITAQKARLWFVLTRRISTKINEILLYF